MEFKLHSEHSWDLQQVFLPESESSVFIHRLHSKLQSLVYGYSVHDKRSEVTLQVSYSITLWELEEQTYCKKMIDEPLL